MLEEFKWSYVQKSSQEQSVGKNTINLLVSKYQHSGERNMNAHQHSGERNRDRQSS